MGGLICSMILQNVSSFTYAVDYVTNKLVFIFELFSEQLIDEKTHHPLSTQLIVKQHLGHILQQSPARLRVLLVVNILFDA